MKATLFMNNGLYNTIYWTPLDMAIKYIEKYSNMCGYCIYLLDTHNFTITW